MYKTEIQESTKVERQAILSNEDAKLKVIYIAGNGHSGSTL